MVHDGKGFVLIGLDPGGLPAPIGIIDNEDGDVGLETIAQFVNFLQVSIGTIGKAPQMHELITGLDIVGLIGMYQTQLDVTNAAHAEGLVAFSNGGLDDLADDIPIACGRRLGVGDDDIDHHVLQRDTPVPRRGNGDRRWVERCQLHVPVRRLRWTTHAGGYGPERTLLAGADGLSNFVPDMHRGLGAG